MSNTKMNENAISLMSLAEELETYIQDVIPKSSRISKYGGVLFTLKPDEKEGQFCGVFIYNTHVQISFSKGAHIADAKNLLSGSGKSRRHINFKTREDVNDKDLKKLLVQASKL